jgi:hypothetical protein
MKIKMACSLLMLPLLAAAISRAANPLVDTRHTSDPAARVFSNRVYVYTSHEEPTSKTFADMHTWRALVSDDMATWKDLGDVFTLQGFPWAKQFAWAPDSLECNGKVFLFLPIDRTKIGVAVGDKPEGPFTDAIGKPLIDNAVQTDAGPEVIDPALLVDDDGTTYLYFACRAAKVVKLDPPSPNSPATSKTSKSSTPMANPSPLPPSVNNLSFPWATPMAPTCSNATAPITSCTPTAGPPNPLLSTPPALLPPAPSSTPAP